MKLLGPIAAPSIWVRQMVQRRDLPPCNFQSLSTWLLNHIQGQSSPRNNNMIVRMNRSAPPMYNWMIDSNDTWGQTDLVQVGIRKNRSLVLQSVIKYFMSLSGLGFTDFTDSI